MKHHLFGDKSDLCFIQSRIVFCFISLSIDVPIQCFCQLNSVIHFVVWDFGFFALLHRSNSRNIWKYSEKLVLGANPCKHTRLGTNLDFMLRNCFWITQRVLMFNKCSFLSIVYCPIYALDNMYSIYVDDYTHYFNKKTFESRLVFLL